MKGTQAWATHPSMERGYARAHAHRVWIRGARCAIAEPLTENTHDTQNVPPRGVCRSPAPLVVFNKTTKRNKKTNENDVELVAFFLPSVGRVQPSGPTSQVLLPQGRAASITPGTSQALFDASLKVRLGLVAHSNPDSPSIALRPMHLPQVQAQTSAFLNKTTNIESCMGRTVPVWKKT